MDPARIAELLCPFHPGDLSARQLEQISAYLDLLLRWNARMNLTSVREPESIVTRHFGESLFAAAQLFPAGHLPVGECRLLDIGSGAGFPGLPIKIWAPPLALTLIESRERKAVFLREVVRTLALDQVTVFCGRAEDFPGRADVVTLRAVERFEDILPIAARLCGTAAPGCAAGLALLVGASQVAVAHRLLPDFAWLEPVPIPLSSSRVLLIGTNQPRQEST